MEIEVLPIDIKNSKTPEQAFEFAFSRYLFKTSGLNDFQICNINVKQVLLDTVLITAAVDLSFVCFIMNFFLKTDFKHENEIKAGKYILENYRKVNK